METIMGYPVVEMHAAAGNYDGNHQGVEIIIVHDEEAPTATSAVARFQTPGQQASTTYVIDHLNKRFIRVTAENEVAYGCGNYYWNQRSVQFEMPGFAGRPYDPVVLDMATELIAYLANKYR